MSRNTENSLAVRYIRKISRVCDSMLSDLASHKNADPSVIRRIIETSGEKFLEVAREVPGNSEQQPIGIRDRVRLEVINGGLSD